MKKFSVCFVILVIFAAFVFAIGWTQFKVKPGESAVLVSKTGGVQQKVIESGEFLWNWEFLLPTNANLVIFKTEPKNFTKKISGILPFSDEYKSVYKNNLLPDFSYEFEFSVSLTLNSKYLPYLYKNYSIRSQENLDLYLQNCSDALFKIAEDYYLERAQKNSSTRLEYISFNEIFRNSEFSEDFPFVILLSLNLQNYKIPDFSLYEKAKSDYEKNLEIIQKNENSSEFSKNKTEN